MTTKNTLKRRENFYIGSNDVLANEKLSFKAKGLHGYLCSKPDGWQFYSSEIEKNGTDGSDSIRSGLKELEDAGYLRRTKHHGDGGRICWDWEVFNTPFFIGVDYGTPGGDLTAEVVASRHGDEVIIHSTKVADPFAEAAKISQENALTLEFERFWDLYDKKRNKAKTKGIWKKLPKKDREAAMLAVQAYVASTPDVKYRCDPTTWLNGRRWEDDIIGDTSTGGHLHDTSNHQYSATSFKGG